MRTVTFLLATSLFALCSFADVVHLKGGGTVEGTVEDAGDAWRIRHKCGTVTVRKADVLRIEKKETFEEVLAAKRKEIAPDDPNALAALARWCSEKGRESAAAEIHAAVLELDPDHRGARTALGYVFWEGAWRTEREIMEARGLVLFDGTWMAPGEVEALKARQEREEATQSLQGFLNRRFRQLASRSARTRKKAHDEIVTLARELGNEGLEKFAGDARAYYDRAWEIVARQTGVFEIRAQMSRLKRPIQTLQTTLGTGTPVKIQLPELSVASVGTTVVIPLGR